MLDWSWLSSKSEVQHFIASVINFELAAMMDRQLVSLTSLTNWWKEQDIESSRRNPINIFIDMFAPKWARGPHNLARFPFWDHYITPGYWA